MGHIDTYNLVIHAFADKIMHEILGVEIDCNHHKHLGFEFNKVTVENYYSFLNDILHPEVKSEHHKNVVCEIVFCFKR